MLEQGLEGYTIAGLESNILNILWRAEPLPGKEPVNIVPQLTIAVNNRTLITKQPSDKQISSTTEAVFPLGPCGIYITTACN
jgi:hypothetical protein